MPGRPHTASMATPDPAALAQPLLRRADEEAREVGKLLQGVVVEVGVYDDDEFGPIPAIVVAKDGERFGVLAMRDPEGNGPGQLEISPVEVQVVDEPSMGHDGIVPSGRPHPRAGQ